MAQRVELREITTDELRTLVPAYEEDLAPFLPPDAGPMRLDLYLDDAHERYAVLADGGLAGFAIVSRGEAFRDPGELVWWMDEFFVVSAHRRSGVGTRAAMSVIDDHPGSWEVGQLAANVPAQAFWRAVIGRYTHGRFEEFQLDVERWRGPVQYFRTT